MKYLQNQESFSFSTSSKNGLFSDDEDGESDGPGGRISGHRQNDYFEISLPPPPPSPSATKTNHGDAKKEEFEFCFSFNSSSTLVDFPSIPNPANSNHPFHHDELPMTTSTFAPSQLVNVGDKKHNHRYKVNNLMNYKRIFQKASSPRCHQGLVSPYIFPPSRLRTFDETQRGLINYRNSPRLGGIRKFMVKLRSIKSMLRSSLNASRRLHPPAKVKVNKKIQKTSTDHKQRDCSHMTNKSIDNNDIVEKTLSQSQNQEEQKSSKGMNFYGFSKMLDVIMKNLRMTRRSKQTYSKSCPVSIKSSPMHDPSGNARDERRNSFYSRDHSIQAAIAHCKKSFGK
ncbi:hypothetical protein HanXRQr2_Chr10g0427461 [Helianthus annuus]|uniref:Uncharacterized protein n=1 Tax=Helianthus annuus TaxID=4232 RepID=A0A251TIC5_HELAN|nr:uncharacterized protein LOC110884439 [Helianthus annuus]KAF5785335.1 hypothetical protein HanXRQr2_Chr10g0427461 [Helianthus annuus]